MLPLAVTWHGCRRAPLPCGKTDFQTTLLQDKQPFYLVIPVAAAISRRYSFQIPPDQPVL